MMRELKFRAWDGGHMWKVTAIGFTSNTVTMISSTNKLRVFLRESVELMKFTGIQDINGKDIYEGDIIKYNTYSDKWIQAVIKFGYTSLHTGYEWAASSQAICFYLDGSEKDNSEEAPYGLGNSSRHYEVIGNIHENPELLK